MVSDTGLPTSFLQIDPPPGMGRIVIDFVGSNPDAVNSADGMRWLNNQIVRMIEQNHGNRSVQLVFPSLSHSTARELVLEHQLDLLYSTGASHSARSDQYYPRVLDDGAHWHRMVYGEIGDFPVVAKSGQIQAQSFPLARHELTTERAAGGRRVPQPRWSGVTYQSNRGANLQLRLLSITADLFQEADVAAILPRTASAGRISSSRGRPRRRRCPRTGCPIVRLVGRSRNICSATPLRK